MAMTYKVYFLEAPDGLRAVYAAPKYLARDISTEEYMKAARAGRLAGCFMDAKRELERAAFVRGLEVTDVQKFSKPGSDPLDIHSSTLVARCYPRSVEPEVGYDDLGNPCSEYPI